MRGGLVGAALLPLLLLVVAPAAVAQSGEGQTPHRVADVRLRGELAPFGRAELAELLRTRPNRRFLGLPGVTPGLWVYRAGSDDGALGRAVRRAGEPPAWHDPRTVEADRERLEGLYRQAGFLGARVHAETDTLGGRRVRVTFDVRPGPPSVVRRVRYEGLEALTPDERRRLARGTVLALEHPADPEALAGLDLPARPGQRLAEAQLLDERRRLLALLRDLGFATVSRDSIRAIAFPRDTLASGSPVFDVVLQVRPGPRYAFGDVRFVVEGPEGRSVRTDSARVGDGMARVRIEGDDGLRPALLYRTLRFEPGVPYRLSAVQSTRRRLERTGVFTFSEVVPLVTEVQPADASGDLPRLPHQITLRTRQRHAVRVEGFALQRMGVLAGEGGALADGELGLGIGASYRNANAFGGGEQVAVGISGSIAGDLARQPTTQLEATAALTLPYLGVPLGGLERALRPSDVRTRLQVGFLTARRDELRLLIRGRASAGLRYELQHAPTLTSTLDLLDFRLSDPDTLGGFRQQVLDFIPDPVARQFVLDDYTRPQVHDAVRYALLSLTADPFRRDRGHAREFAVEVGGVLAAALDRFVFTPGTVEGSLPGLPLFGGGSRLEYRPYVRATLDAREYLRPDRRTVLAVRGFAGLAHPIGGSPVVPLDRRFYAGGAHSVRGWDLRRLGPGRLPAETSAFVQGGDVQLEASAEVRHVVLRNLFAADWQATAFADVGNVWFGPRNPGDPDGRFRAASFPAELAVGAGAGVRVAWEFLILRADLAWQVRSPVPGEPLFPQGSTPRVHFGIGQAF